MMKAGTYYIGDLCYVIRHSTKGPDGIDNWARVCDLICFDGKVGDGEFDQTFPLKGNPKETGLIHFACYGTKYGDGVYDGHSVDSGTIGCVAIDDLTMIENFDIEKMKELGSIVEFESNFHTFEEDGKIHFGNIVIDTDPDWDEDDEYCDYDDEVDEYEYDNEDY